MHAAVVNLDAFDRLDLVKITDTAPDDGAAALGFVFDLRRQVAAEVRKYFGNQVFETIIPRTVKLSEAPSYGIPITQYDPLGKGAISYMNLAKEVIERG